MAFAGIEPRAGGAGPAADGEMREHAESRTDDRPEPVTSQTAAGPGRVWRVSRWAVLGVASLIALLCVTLVFAALRNDRAISANLGTATAQVEQVSFDRAIIRFDTPDGVSHNPANGVLYPEGLSAGQLVRIEYDTTDPELARVAGRTWVLTLLPVSTTVVITWLVAGPLLWWIRARSRAAGAAGRR